jgi:hypothetical protein
VVDVAEACSEQLAYAQREAIERALEENTNELDVKE